MIPDYSQTAENHASLLVLIQQIGNEIQPAVFDNIQKILSSFRTFTLSKPTRKIKLVYKNEYSKEKNAWGVFQAHRKALGLIHVGQCNLRDHKAEDNKNAYLQLHKKNKSEYQETLLDSVLILIDNNGRFSPQTDDSLGEMKNFVFYTENKDESEERNKKAMKNVVNNNNNLPSTYNTKPPIHKQVPFFINNQKKILTGPIFFTKFTIILINFIKYLLLEIICRQMVSLTPIYGVFLINQLLKNLRKKWLIF